MHECTILFKCFCCSSFWQLTCRFNQVFIAPAQHWNYSSIFQDVQVWLLSLVQVIFLVLYHLWFTFIVTVVQLTLSLWGTHVIYSVNILYSNDYLCTYTVHKINVSAGRYMLYGHEESFIVVSEYKRGKLFLLTLHNKGLSNIWILPLPHTHTRHSLLLTWLIFY